VVIRIRIIGAVAKTAFGIYPKGKNQIDQSAKKKAGHWPDYAEVSEILQNRTPDAESLL
jgi:hypothetical protein